MLFFVNLILQKIQTLFVRVKVANYSRLIGTPIRYIPQGDGGVTIAGDIKKFKIDQTSHLKSNTYIECNGGVEIGRYFHCGRGLTILSSNHDYKSNDYIPYGHADIFKPVRIEDFVWCGINVLVLPGVTLGEGSIVGAGSVVTKDIPELAIVAGNPAKIIKMRDREKFEKLKNEGKFH